jgi:uncharacterized membrane protein YvbJ
MNKGRISTALIAAIIAVLVIASASLIYQQSSRARETQSMQKALADWDRAQRGQKQPVPIYPRP